MKTFHWAERCSDYTATALATREPVETESNCYYHLRDGKVSEFWVLANTGFDD